MLKLKRAAGSTYRITHTGKPGGDFPHSLPTTCRCRVCGSRADLGSLAHLRDARGRMGTRGHYACSNPGCGRRIFSLDRSGATPEGARTTRSHVRLRAR